MYSLPSTSCRTAPWPRAKNSGSPPTALKARTGEFTPPGMTWRAFSKRLRETLPMALAARTLKGAPGGRSPREQARGLLGEVGDDHVGARAPDGDERFENRALAVDPAVAGRGGQHRVLAGDMVGRDGHIDGLPHTMDDVEVRQGRLHHDHVRPFLDVAPDDLQGLADVARVHLVTAAVAELRSRLGRLAKGA